MVKTADLAPLASLVAAASVVALGGGYMARNLASKLQVFLERPETMDLRGAGGVEILHQAMLAAAPIMGAVFAAACIAGIAGNVVQTGLVFSPQKLMPSLDKISPGAGLKRMVSLDGLVQFLKSFVKLLLTAALAWWVLQPRISDLQGLSRLDPLAILPLAADILRRLVFAVAGFLLLIAGADWFYQRQSFMKKMRMTKEEVKDDFKQTEGDPHIKARQRQLRQERARRRMMQAVPTATVVVMNPTHYAVALKYDAGEAPAPMCVAKGMDSLALKIRALAEESGVPIIEDPPLARALYASVEIDEVIPPAHYEAVAKVIGFIMNASRRVAGQIR